MPTALVTGITGQDGVLLARELRRRGWDVVGLARDGARRTAMAPYLTDVTVRTADVRDTSDVVAAVRSSGARAVVNLAGLSSVGRSWDDPATTHAVNGEAVVRLVDALARLDAPPRFVQASTAEVYGPGGPHTETSRYAPVNPYGESKAVAQRATTAAREERGVWACSAVMFNHESPLRGREFVTRKITRAAATMARGEQDRLVLGGVEVQRDWSGARDYVRGLAELLERDEPVDLVLASGATHSLRELVDAAFDAAGVEDPWSRIDHDPALVRPVDAPLTVGDPSLARDVIGWELTQTFEDVIGEMVEVDLRRLSTGVEEDPAYLA